MLVFTHVDTVIAVIAGTTIHGNVAVAAVIAIAGVVNIVDVAT